MRIGRYLQFILAVLLLACEPTDNADNPKPSPSISDKVESYKEDFKGAPERVDKSLNKDAKKVKEFFGLEHAEEAAQKKAAKEADAPKAAPEAALTKQLD